MRKLRRKMVFGVGGITALLLFCAQAEMRTWTLKSGQTVEAEYLSTTLDYKAALQLEGGRKVEVPLAQLSTSDLEYVALQHPPRMKIEFGSSSKVVTLESSERWPDNPAVTLETLSFNIRIKQLDTKLYPFGLKAEYYAIGYQHLDHDKYIILDKGSVDFVLNKENDYYFMHETASMNMPLEFTLDPNHYGQKFCNCLVLVYDQRGEVVAYKATKNWIYDHLEKIRKLPAGAFFNDTGTRVHASGPVSDYGDDD